MIKVDAYGDSAKLRTIYICRYHVNIQFNKIPQLAMGSQCERDGGIITQGIGWGVNQTPKPIGCDQMSMGKPMNPQYLFVPCPQSFISSKSWLRQLIPWEEQGMTV